MVGIDPDSWFLAAIRIWNLLLDARSIKLPEILFACISSVVNAVRDESACKIVPDSESSLTAIHFSLVRYPSPDERVPDRRDPARLREESAARPEMSNGMEPDISVRWRFSTDKARMVTFWLLRLEVLRKENMVPETRDLVYPYLSENPYSSVDRVPSSEGRVPLVESVRHIRIRIRVSDEMVLSIVPLNLLP